MKAIVQLSVYGGALVSLMLPFYDFECHCFFSGDSHQKLKTAAYHNLGSISRAQQAYFLERKEFATHFEDLQVGINPDTEDYRYQILEPMVPVPSIDYPLPKPPGDRVFAIAQSKNSRLNPSYLSGVFVISDPNPSERTTAFVICRTKLEPSSLSQLPRRVGDEIICPPGTQTVE